jgi:hypothetical protein
MVNRITGGQGLFGSVNVSSSAQIATAGITTLHLGGTQITATSTEINESDISTVGASRKIGKIAVSGVGLGSSEMDSGFDLPTKGLVHDIWVDVTVSATNANTMNVGLLSTTSGDADGFLVAISATSGALQHGYITATTSGLLNSYFGALWAAVDQVGAGGDKFSFRNPYDVQGSIVRTISYTLSTTQNDNFAANIFVDYTEIA